MEEHAMNKEDVPESFGVFKPVGHVVMAFATPEDQRAAAQALQEDGFAAKDVVPYSADEMKKQAQGELENAGPLAALGQEKNLVTAHLQRSQQGQSWLVVFAPETEQTERVAVIAKRCNAQLAQKYGRWMIEELI